MPMSPVEISLVIPVYNEEEVLPALTERLTATLSRLGGSVEVLLVNDGSRDGTERLLGDLAARDPRFRAIHFSRNFGHQAAITAGVQLARGRAVIVMDADLQDPPELVEQMIARWGEGYHVVYAKRESRQHESALKRGLAYSFYRVLQRLSDVRIPEDTGDFCLMDRVVVDHLNAMPERNRYMRGLRAWLGFRQTEVVFARPPRAAGEPKYTFRKSLSLGISAILGFSKVPLRVGTYLGFVVSAVSFLLALAFVGMRLAGMDVVRGWASTIVLVLFLGGVQLLTLGVIGEYLSRIYDEVKQRPLYVIRRADGFAVETLRDPVDDALRLAPRA
jgi:glycosyltransferase involved in cell wall biosynthesis